MNADRRNRISIVAAKLEELKTEIEGIASEERDYADNMPENMQGNEKHSRAEEVADSLESIDLQEVIDTLNEAAS